MSPAAAPRPAPLARIRLERVPFRRFDGPAPVPVFHVFEELARRCAEAGRSAHAARRVSMRA